MKFISAAAFCALVVLSACQQAATPAASSDACAASQHQNLVGGPSSVAGALDIPDESRHYGSEERVATDDPTRLNFVHSGTAIESITDPDSTVIRVFCG